MRKYLLFIIASFALSAFASDEVVIVQPTGQVSWEIAKIKDLSFDGNGVKLSFNDNTSVYYEKGALSMIKFNTTLSGINSIDNTSQAISIAENCIVVEGFEGNITVYSLHRR